MSVRIVVVALASIALCASGVVPRPALAQTSADNARVPTLTRLVKQFSELEADLGAKLAARDRAGVDPLLDGDFEVRRSSSPGAPIPRADWIRDSLGAAKPRIEQMAVHDFGTVAVVSFRQVETARRSKAPSARLIVDCWARAGERWVLAVRYEGMPEAVAADRRDVRATGR